MPRFPKLYDRGSIRRTAIAIGLLALAIGGFYVYQPQRYDFIERKPPEELSRIDIDATGLFEANKRVVVVTAHPDDEAFYLGGTLFKLKESRAKVSLVVMTDGDKAYYPFFDSDPLRAVRREETRAAASRVGIKEVVFLGYPDGRLSFEPDVTARLATEIRRLEPEIVLCSDPYYWTRVGHRDHRVAGELSQKALMDLGFTGWVLYFSTVAPNTFADVGKTWSDAQGLLAVHKSQFHGERLELIRGLVSERAIESGESFGVGFAESFRAMRFVSGRESLP